MTGATCGTMFDAGFGGPTDRSGCHLPRGHVEPHEFKATDGRTYQWETDWACNCESCRDAENGDGDYCTIYSEKQP